MPSQTTGVDKNQIKVVDLTDEDDDEDDEEDDIDLSAISYNYKGPKARIPKKEEDPDTGDDQHTLEQLLGRGMRIRKRPLVYEPSMSGKPYKMGVANLCYRGNRYKLKDGIVSLNIDSHVEHHPETDEGEINGHIPHPRCGNDPPIQPQERA